MPWSIVQNHQACPAGRPFAVVNDDSGETEGCHPSEQAAEEQRRALYASEGSASALIVATGVLDDGGEGEDADRRRDLIRQIELGNINAFSVEPAGLDVEEDCAQADAEGRCERFRLTFSRYRIGAASVVTIPAIEGTLIEMGDRLPDGGRPFTAILARENIETDEGPLTRRFPAHAFEWGEGPWTVTAHHDDYVILGRIERIARAPLAATEPADEPAAPVVASAAGDDLVVPAAWLAEPEDLPDLDEPGSRVPVVTAEGRVYGYICAWDDCHVSYPGYCQTPWRSTCGYAYALHSGPFLTDAGERVALMPLAASGGHYTTQGDAARDWRGAQRHYDDPDHCAAYVMVGENDRGIWFSGIVRPDAPDSLVRLLSRHQLSADYRRPFGAWELHGACSINQPGFVRRAAWAASASGELELVAAVVASPSASPPAGGCGCGGTCRTGATAAYDEPAATIVDQHAHAGVDALGVEARLAGVEARLAVLADFLEPAIRESLRSRLRAGD